MGILRFGLGRLVVLGPGRKRIVHALAGGYCADTFLGGDRKTWRIQKLDGAARDYGFFIQFAGYLSGSLRRIDLSAFLRFRSYSGYFHLEFPGGRNWSLLVIVCMAGTQGRIGWKI